MKPKTILCLALVLSGGLFGCASASAQLTTNKDLIHPVIGEIHDVGYGTFESSEDFVFKRTGTKDSFMGTLARKTDGFIITFDVGLMAGVHMSDSNKAKCTFYRRHSIGGIPASTGIERVEDGQRITTTIDYDSKTQRVPVNFWADIRKDSDIVEFLAIVTTYKSEPDAIDLFVANLSAYHGLWLNGADADHVTQAVSPEEVVSETFRMADFERSRVTSYQILKIRQIHIKGVPDTYTAVLADTNLGRMIVIMQYIAGKGSTPGHWWRRIYDAHPTIKRLY